MTPLSTVIDNDEGELLGTAGYISLLGNTLLITNDHNFKDPDVTQIAAQFPVMTDISGFIAAPTTRPIHSMWG